MTTAPIPTAAPAATPVTSPGGTAPSGGRADGAAGPFTSLLAAALGGEDIPPSVVQALAELADDAESAEAAGEQLAQEAVTEAVAAVAGAVPSPPAPLVEWATRVAAGTTGQDVDSPQGNVALAASDDAIALAQGKTDTDGAQADPVATPAAPAPPAAPTGPASPIPTATPTAPSLAQIPATPAPTASVPDGAVIEGTVAGQASAAAPPVAAAAKATGAVSADADPATSSEPAPVPATPSSSATSATAASAAPAATAATEDAGLHARIVARVVQAVEALENAPPPRRMTVEVPDSDGLRLQVAMRGGEVHVSVLAGTGQPDLGAWGRELASTLAARGMTLGGFQTGTDGHPGRQPGQPDQPDPDQPGSRDGRPRAPRTDDRPARDGDLRL